MQQPLPNNNIIPQPSFNQNYMQQPMTNPEDITDPTTAINMELTLMAKAFKLNYSTPTNNNQRTSSNPHNRQIAQPGMNMGQDRQMQMVGGNGGNQFRQYAGQNNVGNQHGLIVVLGIANQNPNGNGNVVAAQAEGNAIGNNGNQIRCYNCRGLGHLARNCTVRPRRRDAAYLQTQLLIAQKEEAGIQLQAEEFDLMAAAADLDEFEEVNANYILMANLQQASTSGTQTDKAPIYDSDGSTEVQLNGNCYDNEIFNMFTQEEQYTDLLEPIPEPHQVQQNDNNVISNVPSVEQNGGTIEQCPANVKETRALYDSLYNNLATEVEKVNSVNRKMKATNAELTTELARYKNQEKFFEINQEKYDKLERCYQKSVYQEQCLTKKINALYLSSAKMITTLKEEIANLNNMLSKENSTVSSLQEEKKRLKSDFKIRKDELLDKQIQLETKIKELDNILVKTEKHDPPAVYDYEETLQLAQESRLKMKQLNKEIKLANYTKINHLSGVFVSQSAKSRKESYFTNTSKTATVSKSISIPNEEFSDDTTPSVARKFLNEVKSTIVTLQRVVKQKMTLDIHNWSSSVHQELHKILKDEIFPIINQVDARLQNFEIQFLKEAAKLGRDFKSLANEADESLDKQKTLELEIDRLLRAVTELERSKERFENSTIKKETEYAKLWNDWYEKCQECKYDKISYDKAYNDMQHKIEWLQAQLGDLKGKCKDTPGVSDTLEPLSQKLENENVELEFQVSEQKNTTKGTSANTKFANQSIMGKPFSQPIRNNFVMRQPNAFKSDHSKFSNNQDPHKVDKTNDLSKPVTSNSVPITKESSVVKNDNVLAPGMSKIDPRKTSREDKFAPINKVRASSRTNPITVSQPHVITKKDVNSDSNGLSSTGLDNIAKTRRPQPRSNTKTDRVPSAPKSRCFKNNEMEVEEHHRNLLLSKNKKHMSSECNNVKLAIQNDNSEVVCAICKQCLINANHDVCVLKYVNGMNFRRNNQKANVSNIKNQKKQKLQVWKPKKVGSKERLASPKSSTPRSCLRWSPTGRIFDLKGKIIESSESDGQSDISEGDIICTSNPQEPSEWTKKVIETMNVTFDELLAMAFEQSSSIPGLQGMASAKNNTSGPHLNDK
ncbi:retrovirus-related pol polyprotein from transposon TNT 1-94 [Tanacetum coccineum]